MFVSLRFPDGKEYSEVPLSNHGIRKKIPESLKLSEDQIHAILRFLPRSCPDPKVLDYRAELAAELVSSPELEGIFRELSELKEKQALVRSGGTDEINKLQTVTAFQTFAQRFDRFYKILGTTVPKSAAAKRCFLFCRNYGESFEYKELKTKAAELIRAFGFSYGFSLAVGIPTDEKSLALLRKESSTPEGVRFEADRVIAEFGGTPLQGPKSPHRPYSDIEVAVLTGIIRKDPKLTLRLEEFVQSYASANTEEILRLSEEALFFVSINELYKAGRSAGYSLCRPQFRKPGFYSEITGLCYPSQSGVTASDYIASPLDHVTVVCGPDAESYLNAVGFAHLVASAGGLVFAKEAQISPINHLEYDHKERISTEKLNEDSLCLCGHLFDAMLPRQEDAAVSEVLLRLAEHNTRSVVRICSKSNLNVLQNKIDQKQLPPCTLLQAGTDRTLEELLQRHKLTPEKEVDA